MNIKLLIGGKEMDAQISEEDAQKIQPSESRFVKTRDKGYWVINNNGDIFFTQSSLDPLDKARFSIGNYFTSKQQAQDHIRALKLWQAIKVFRQEREGDAWKKYKAKGSYYFIVFDKLSGNLKIDIHDAYLDSNVCFNSEETAQAVIDEFYGELMWYFTEFQDD